MFIPLPPSPTPPRHPAQAVSVPPVLVGDQPATVVVRVGNNRPDLDSNPVCNRFIGLLEEGRPLFLPCNPPMPGAFVSVHIEGPPGVQLSICEAFVYTDQVRPSFQWPLDPQKLFCIVHKCGTVSFQNLRLGN